MGEGVEDLFHTEGAKIIRSPPFRTLLLATVGSTECKTEFIMHLI